MHPPLIRLFLDRASRVVVMSAGASLCASRRFARSKKFTVFRRVFSVSKCANHRPDSGCAACSMRRDIKCRRARARADGEGRREDAATMPSDAFVADSIYIFV
jgi:hypothetical protein